MKVVSLTWIAGSLMCGVALAGNYETVTLKALKTLDCVGDKTGVQVRVEFAEPGRMNWVMDSGSYTVTDAGSTTVKESYPEAYFGISGFPGEVEIKESGYLRDRQTQVRGYHGKGGLYFEGIFAGQGFVLVDVNRIQLKGEGLECVSVRF